MGPRARLDDMKKGKFLTLSRLELRPLGRLVIQVKGTLQSLSLHTTL
jgi:hypothetical protein